MKIFSIRKTLTGLTSALVSALSLLWGQSAFGEAQYNITMSMSAPSIGANSSFTASDSTSSGDGTFYNTYSGIGRYVLGTTVSGRYSTFANTTRYGVELEGFHIFQSFLSSRTFTVVSSNTACPGGTNTYGFINIRTRSATATINPQDASAVGFRAGGVFTYNAASSPDISGTNYFNLAGPTLTTGSPAFTADGLSGATCSSGTYKITASAVYPWDQYSAIYFGPSGGVIVGLGGNPMVSILSPIEDLTVARMGQLSGRVMSGIYSEYQSTIFQRQIYLYPDASGTTFTLREVTDFDDPAQYTTFGTLTCTSRNSPTQGFCSGTLTRNGVSGSGKVVCQVSKRTASDILTCSGQKPDANSTSFSILARNFGQAFVGVTLTSPTFNVASLTSTTTDVTVRNLSGNPVGSLSEPTAPQDRLVAPFSLPTPFTGAGGTCGSSLNGYSSCLLTVAFAPSDPGTYSQVLRVQYDNQIATVNATANVIGAVKLSSIIISPSGSLTVGGTQQYTATGVYSDGSTQDITSVVAWTTSDGTKMTISSTGLGTAVAAGSVNVTGTLGAINNSAAITVSAGSSAPAVDFAMSEPNGTSDTVALGEPYNIRFTGGADTDSNANVYFYYKATNTNCSSGLAGWTIINPTAPAKEDTDSGYTWNTTGLTAGSYYVCGVITDGVTTRYAVSSGQMTVSAIATAKLIKVNPSSTSEKPYYISYDVYEAHSSAAGTLDNTNAYASNTTSKVAQSLAGTITPQASISWPAAYRSCANRGADWRLPTPQEFVAASIGTPNNPGACNTITNIAPTVIPAFGGTCVSSGGIYDLVGNLNEWTDLITTTDASRITSSSAIKAATDYGGAWVGKTAASYNALTLPATGVTTAFDPDLGITRTGGSQTVGFFAGDIATHNTSVTAALIRGGYYNTPSGATGGGLYQSRLSVNATTGTSAFVGYRCAKNAYTIPAVKITAPTRAAALIPDGSNNVTVTFQAYDSDDNATVSLYYKNASLGTAGCSGDPAANGWTAIDTTLQENSATSKVVSTTGWPTGYYLVCARVADGKNSSQYDVSTGTITKGSPGAHTPLVSFTEPNGNNDVVVENASYMVQLNAVDYDSNATVTLFWKTGSNTGCYGTPTSQGWTAITTTPSTISEDTVDKAYWDLTPINTVTYPASFYLCAQITDTVNTNYATTGTSTLTVTPVSRCITESGNYSTANGGCYNSSRVKTWSIDGQSANATTYTFTGAATYCSGLNTSVLGGYADWRVPTQTELTNLYSDGISNLRINTASSKTVWTSDNGGAPGGNAVNFNLTTGSAGSVAETSNLNAICVRP